MKTITTNSIQMELLTGLKPNQEFTLKDALGKLVLNYCIAWVNLMGAQQEVLRKLLHLD